MVFLGFVAFFGVVVTVNAVMLSLALDTMPGLTTDSSYKASQRFNPRPCRRPPARCPALEGGGPCGRDASGTNGA